MWKWGSVTITPNLYAVDITVPRRPYVCEGSRPYLDPEPKPADNKPEEPSRTIIGNGTKIYFRGGRTRPGQPTLPFQFVNEKKWMPRSGTRRASHSSRTPSYSRPRTMLVNGLVTYALDKEYVRQLDSLQHRRRDQQRSIPRTIRSSSSPLRACPRFLRT